MAVDGKKKGKKGDPKANAIEPRKKKVEPLFEIEGNQKLNKLSKLQFKKQKKERAKRGLWNFRISIQRI